MRLVGVVVGMLAIVGIRFRSRFPEVLALVAVAIVTGRSRSSRK